MSLEEELMRLSLLDSTVADDVIQYDSGSDTDDSEDDVDDEFHYETEISIFGAQH